MPKSLPFISVLQVVALSTGIICIQVPTQALGQERCIVADPTGTPLNVRSTPDGHVIQTLNNGISVTIFDRMSFRGKHGSTSEDTKIEYPSAGFFATIWTATRDNNRRNKRRDRLKQHQISRPLPANPRERILCRSYLRSHKQPCD